MSRKEKKKEIKDLKNSALFSYNLYPQGSALIFGASVKEKGESIVFGKDNRPLRGGEDRITYGNAGENPVGDDMAEIAENYTMETAESTVTEDIETAAYPKPLKYYTFGKDEFLYCDDKLLYGVSCGDGTSYLTPVINLPFDNPPTLFLSPDTGARIFIAGNGYLVGGAVGKVDFPACRDFTVIDGIPLALTGDGIIYGNDFGYYGESAATFNKGIIRLTEDLGEGLKFVKIKGRTFAFFEKGVVEITEGEELFLAVNTVVRFSVPLKHATPVAVGDFGYFYSDNAVYRFDGEKTEKAASVKGRITPCGDACVKDNLYLLPIKVTLPKVAESFSEIFGEKDADGKTEVILVFDTLNNSAYFTGGKDLLISGEGKAFFTGSMKRGEFSYSAKNGGLFISSSDFFGKSIERVSGFSAVFKENCEIILFGDFGECRLFAEKGKENFALNLVTESLSFAVKSEGQGLAAENVEIYYKEKE